MGVVEFEHARKQGRADLGNGGAHRVAIGAEHVPEHGRAAFVGIALDADLPNPCGDLFVVAARHREACDIALHIGQEHRHAQARKAFGQHHQRDRFAGAGGTCNETVAVAVSGQKRDEATFRRGDGLADENIVHGWGFLCGDRADCMRRCGKDADIDEVWILSYIV